MCWACARQRRNSQLLTCSWNTRRRFGQVFSHAQVDFHHADCVYQHLSVPLLGVSKDVSCCCLFLPFYHSTPAVGQCMGQVDLHRRPRSLAVCHARTRYGSREYRYGVFGRLATSGADPRRGSEETRTGSIHGASECRPQCNMFSYTGISRFVRARTGHPSTCWCLLGCSNRLICPPHPYHQRVFQLLGPRGFV